MRLGLLGRGSRLPQAPGELLGLADRQPVLDDHRNQVELLDGGQADQRPGMPLAQTAVGNRRLDALVELQEAERVGDRGPGTADLAGDLVLGQAKLLLELAEGVRLLDRVEVLTLDVLDQCQLELLAIGELADHGRDSLEAGQAGSLDPALAGHDPVTVKRLGHQDRLEDAVIGDARRKRLEVGMFDVTAGLVRVGPNLAERDLMGTGLSFVAGWDQG